VLVGTPRCGVRSAQRADPTSLLALLERAQAGIHGVFAKQLLDAQELVVFRQTVGAAQGTGLDLAAVRGDRDVGDGGVLGFADSDSNKAANSFHKQK
jgi:hypothetical protein